MTIVCATHFTATSSDAVIVAAHLARRTGERLVLATVLSRGLGASGPGAQAASDALDRERQRLSALGLDVEATVLHGRVDRALGRLSSDVGARLLVVGDRRRTSFLSTPVERIAFGVSVPLLVVRDLEPFQSWARGERPLAVLLGTGSTSTLPVAREWLTWLAAAGPLDVLVTQVWDPQEHGHGGTAAPRAGDHDGLAETRRQDLRASLLGLPLHVTSRVHLEVGPGAVGELLPRIAAREKVDLLVLGTHPRSGLLPHRASVAHEVLERASMSVALVPRREAEVGEELSRASPTSPRTMRERLRRSAVR